VIERGCPQFLERHNPFIRTIVLRTRDYLESTIDPETQEPYLKPVRVPLHGERGKEAIPLPIAVPKKHPFQLRCHRVRPVDWESCAEVLSDS